MPHDTHETAPTRFVEASGIRFAYRRFGRPGGTPLLLLNYFAANLDNWDPRVTNGFAAERDVILVDYPGIGGSSANIATSSSSQQSASTSSKIRRTYKSPTGKLPSTSW